MTTSRTKRFLSEIEAGDVPIPPEKLAYFQARLRNSLYHFILTKFVERERSGKITKALLARRIGSDPAVVSRLLGAPGNWTLDTASNLLIGIAGEELIPASEPIIGRVSRNYSGPEWLKPLSVVAGPLDSPTMTERPKIWNFVHGDTARAEVSASAVTAALSQRAEEQKRPTDETLQGAKRAGRSYAA